MRAYPGGRCQYNGPAEGSVLSRPHPLPASRSGWSCQDRNERWRGYLCAADAWTGRAGARRHRGCGRAGRAVESRGGDAPRHHQSDHRQPRRCAGRSRSGGENGAASCHAARAARAGARARGRCHGGACRSRSRDRERSRSGHGLIGAWRTAATARITDARPRGFRRGGRAWPALPSAGADAQIECRIARRRSEGCL